jgi:outer membrane protein OmpA-like peptidoglycan-associated protein
MGRFVESVQTSFELQGVFDASGSSILGGAGGAVMPGAPVIVPAFGGLPLPSEQTRLTEIQGAAERILSNANLRDRVSVRMESRGLTISLPETGFFGTGSADISSGAQPVANEIAELLRGIPNRILIEGHSDNVPIRSGPHRSNWELSTARATGVVRMLIDMGFAPERLSAAGYAEFRPVATNDTPDGRAQNRRVDLVVLSEEPPEVIDLSDSPERMREVMRAPGNVGRDHPPTTAVATPETPAEMATGESDREPEAVVGEPPPAGVADSDATPTD